MNFFGEGKTEANAARFEITAFSRDSLLESELQESGVAWKVSESLWKGEMMLTTYTWDVEDPAFSGPVARSIAWELAKRTKSDVYFGWQSLTGWVLEAGSEEIQG